MNRLIVVLIMFTPALEVGADSLNKCVSASGRVEYRDYACDVSAASSQKMTVRENTSGSGQDLAGIRQRDAEFKQRQDAKRAAQDRADEQRRIDNERRFNEERAHRDRQALVDAVRENNVQNYSDRPPNYNNVPYDQRVQTPKAPVVPVAPAKPASGGIPAQPRKPNQNQ